MLLALSPGMADWLQPAAYTALVAHIAAGALGLVCGFAALMLPKGGPWHRRAGLGFLVSMATMASLAILIAASKGERSNAYAGALTLYLVATAWASARRSDGPAGRFERGSLVVAAALALVGAAGLARSILHPAFGYPWASTIHVGAAWAAAAGDLRTVRIGLASAQRVGRHLWRMCAALFIASVFFVVQPRIFATPNPALVLAAGAPLAVMAYWLIRLSRAATSKRPWRGATQLGATD